MFNQNSPMDLATALSYLGKTVLLEQGWQQEADSFWQCMHIVGVVLPMEGVCKYGCFLVVEVSKAQPHPNEVFFSDIRTIRVMRHRDRHGSGTVLGRITHSNLAGSRAALPARRNGSNVPANGSTGAAHP